MAFSISENSIVSLNFDSRHFGQQLLLTTHWSVFSISPGSTVDFNEFIDAWTTVNDTAGELGDQYASSLSEDVIGLNYIYQLIHPVRFVRFISASAFDGGQVAEPSLPPNASHIITLRADSAGPAFRGNKHIGGVPASWSENGLPTMVALTQYANLAAELEAVQEVVVGADTVQMQPIIFDRGDPPSSPFVTNFILGQTTRVERRRTVGLGS